MKVGYFVKSLGQTIENTRYLEDVNDKEMSEDQKETFVIDAGHDMWVSNNEIDWLEGKNIITLVVDGAEKGDFAISAASVFDFPPMIMVDMIDTIN